MKDSKKDEYRINVRTTKERKDELKALSSQTGIPASVIIREAVTEKIAEMREMVERGEKIELGVVTR